MSDRIARLAELRRKRDSASSNTPDVAVQNVSGSSGQPTSITTQQTAAKKDHKELIELQNPLEENSESIGASEKQIVNDASATSLDQSPVVGISGHIKGSELAENEQEFAAYNRDLKHDLSSLLNKAKSDTERAINEIMWRSYRDKQAD